MVNTKQKNKMKNGWKIFGIIILIIFILENAFLIWAGALAYKDIENKNKCSTMICGDPNINSTSFDYNKGLCSCYDNNANLVRVQFIK